jgi:multimeric flavodoxin WrbA
MVSADAIVMATPVYFYTMCAQMKAVIDRTVARYTEVQGKEFYFIVTAADGSKPAMERTIEGFRGFTSCLTRAREKGVVLGVGVWEQGAVRKTRAMHEAYAMGRAV